MSNSWPSVPVGTVARIEIGGTPSRDELTFWADRDNGRPWASIADLTSSVVTETAEYISDLGVRSSNVKLVPAGTPIMSFKLTIGRTSIAGRDLYTNEAIAAFFVDSDKVDRKFLFHALPRVARSVVTDVAIKGATLNKKSILSMQLRLPPIEEQCRIREVLDLMDGEIVSTEKIVAKLRDSRLGLRAALFCDDSGISWNSDWPTRPLGEVVEAIDSGKSPDCPDTPAAHGQWGVLKVSAIGHEHFRPQENKVIPSRIRVDPRWEVRSGDVLMTRANTPDLVGMVCLVDRPSEGRLALSDKTWRINPGRSFDPHFLVEALRAAPSRRYIQNVATGTSGSMKNFSQLALSKMPVPVPDLQDQRSRATSLATVSGRIDSEMAVLEKLRFAKAGLASDLLRGRVRLLRGHDR